MAPLMLSGMSKNPVSSARSLCCFPTLQESSSTLHVAMNVHLDIAVLELHQMKLSQIHLQQQSETAVSNHQESDRFQANFHVPSSNFDFP